MMYMGRTDYDQLKVHPIFTIEGEAVQTEIGSDLRGQSPEFQRIASQKEQSAV